MPQFTNRLINASSPYLLQHAHNPVDWFEWGNEAFEKAKLEDKLVLVSIGYSACHWCHVMEHECFEQEDTAAIMNEHFVCIKVDREERPDIDQLYMEAIQLLTGRGGWPLNCFVLPDGRPLHGGTYFPKQEWERVLNSLASFYKNKKSEAIDYANELVQGIKKSDLIPSEKNASLPSKQEVSEIMEKWKTNFDTSLGGYQWSPKFPMPNNWEFFLQWGVLNQNESLIRPVHLTLTKMAEGGIYDQLGGGFSRYSTDSFWKVPHFEKMLYDNAQLMSLYASAYQQQKNPLYKKIVDGIHAFIQQELTNAEGLFYSAMDADSEGIEGKYYVWTKKELVTLLGNDEPLFSLYYSIDAYGNWENGENILYKTRSDQELESLTGKPIAEIELIIEEAKKVLLSTRENRIAPGLDDKCITSWNALMIKGYVQAYNVFGNIQFIQTAKRAADALIEKLWKDNKLYRIYKNGVVSIHGFAEDYAQCIDALIQLFEATSENKYLNMAYTIMRSADEQFYDETRSLFYFKSSHDEQLIARKIDVRDDVIPSSNSVFALVLLKLGYYFGNEHYLNLVDAMIQSIQSKFATHTSSYTNWMQVLALKQFGFKQIIICGDDAFNIKQQLHQHYFANSVVLEMKEEGKTIPLLADKITNGKTNIYICIDKTCLMPLETLEEAIHALNIN